VFYDLAGTIMKKIEEKIIPVDSSNPGVKAGKEKLNSPRTPGEKL